MEQIVVKTEVQNNGEILLYYVDENGESQQGYVTTLENIEHSDIENAGIQINDNNYILNHSQILEDYVAESSLPVEVEEEPAATWSDDEMKRLLLFYSDNKSSFLVSGLAQRRHLWSVACKTMLFGKDPETCEAQLSELKSKYDEVLSYLEKGVIVKWVLLEFCQQAFNDINVIEQPRNIIKQEYSNAKKVAVLKQDVRPHTSNIVKQINTRTPDENVEQMLKLYLKYKHKFQKEHWNKDLWTNIALELGNADDGPMWHKRFLNFKQHYINLYFKQQEDSSTPMNWPYMDLFNKIYLDDAEFQRKYSNVTKETVNLPDEAELENEWNTSHITILGKHYYDCYDEFEDPTIPNMFLWTEIGRIIDKKPLTCKEKYASLREEHINRYIDGDYSLQNRNAIDIILDNIIAKDVKRDFNLNADLSVWKKGSIDELIDFFHNNIEAFKDSICHFVCWEAIATKLDQNIKNCKRKWDELVTLYKSLLDEKSNDSELQIDWRYIDVFDRIFNYGMDMNFMVSFYASDTQNNNDGKLTVKKIEINVDNNVQQKPKKSYNEPKTSNTPRTDPRSTKILEFYHKNKDSIENSPSKLELWEPLSKEIDMNTTQCAHRFRHLKKTYLDSVQKEIKNPKSIITWPYFNLCKKVFGYRLVKNRLKTNMSTDEGWLAREIKLLIKFFSNNFHEINNSGDDISIWEPLSRELNKTPLHCNEKFVELRKCYRKLKTMKTRNPSVKISWAHFPMMDRIYSARELEEPMEVETLEEEHLDETMVDAAEEDYQCIIVLQEGQELSDIANGQMIIPDQVVPEHIQEIEAAPLKNLERPSKLWTKRTKKLLLIHYINYMRTHKAKKIIQKQLWDGVAAKIPNKTNKQCKNMFKKLKNAYINAEKDEQKANPLHSLMEKVLKLKPNFSITPIKDAKIQKTYKDVEMDPTKIDSALTYYLNHIDDFVDPKFEKTYLWTELANHISEPVEKVYNKINYLKQAYNVETEEIDGVKTPWSEILNEIIVKEVSTKAILDEAKPNFDDDDNWTTELIESLLTWYLGNLDKFKNPKFNRSYLWIEASSILNKSPVVCSKKMTEIRTQYRNMVKNNDPELDSWCFYDLCQKIYGTGKKTS